MSTGGWGWSRRAHTDTARARSTVRGVLFIQVMANGLGALVVALYVHFLFPEDLAVRSEVNVVAFTIFLGICGIVTLPINMYFLRRAVSWVREGTRPSERQRSLLFWLPLLETLTAFVTWIGSAVLFAVLNTAARRASVGIMLAGLVTCSILYLLLEGHFRPVFALALAQGDVELPENRRDVLPRLMLAWLLGSAIPLAGLGLSPLLGPIVDQQDRLPWLALAGVIGGGAVMAAAAISVARPLNRVRGALRQVEQGDLEVQLPVDDLGELGRLTEGVNDLVAGLRERDHLKDLFGKQVGPANLVELASEGAIGAPGEASRVTVLFVDLQGYTRFSEGNPPSEVVAMLNRFFRVVVAVVNREGGWVNKFEGDAALCLFGAPQDQPDHAARALRTAEALPRELAREDDVLPAGIGVATGEVIAGFVGTADRYEYTVIGDVVNLASRLCDEAKSTPSGVFAAGSTVIEAGLPERWRAAGTRRVRGRNERVEVFSLRRELRDSPRRRPGRSADRPQRPQRSAPPA